MGNLNDIDNNFAALAYELTQTAEWVETHQIKKAKPKEGDDHGLQSE